MDDERIERALRQGPPDEPAYVPRGAVRRVPRRQLLVLKRMGGLAQLAATLAVVAVVVAVVVVIREGKLPGTAATPAPTAAPGLLDAVRSRGVLRVAVAPTYPQVQIAGGVYDGFDISVARAIAARMGLQVEITIVPENEIERGDWTDRWDVAVGVPAIPQRSSRLGFTRPYAYWPALVLVESSSTATSTRDLAGRTACVAAGSVPLAWVQGALAPAALVRAVTPPGGVVITTQSTETACLDLITWDFVVTDRSTAGTLAQRTTLRILATPAFMEPVAASVDNASASPESLIVELNRVLDALRSDGTLSALSQQQLGGTDLTDVP